MKNSKPQKSVAGKALQEELSDESDRKDFLIVGIGASAGGIQALKEFFENVPADSGVAYVVILHLSPDHKSRLAEVLQTTAQIPVTQVKKRVKVEPNHVYVVPPNQHLGMNDGHIVVSPNLSVEERRAPVDIFFRNLAESHYARAIAVVLSGTGADGSMGLKRVKERGGVAFVQNPREAEFNEMPRNSIATELVDAVLNVREIPAKIIAYKNNLGAVEIQDSPESQLEIDTAAVREIFTVLRVRTKHDFSNYKRPTMLRRIERRINVNNVLSLSAYAAFLRANPNETRALLKDLLISVTNFFRDKEAFEILEREVVPRILHDKSASDQIRIWVAGCATGEEAYSLAMMFAEQTAQKPDAPSVQIFATDIDQAAIAAAREGFYTINDAADVSPERLRRFFTQEADGFRVRRELRESILFANHNLIKDPPFSHLDLVTCRNLLIYFNRQAQERAMETFHFALNPGGFLFLGSSESIDGSGDLYAAVNKERRIFQSRQAKARIVYPVPEPPVPSFNFTESIMPLRVVGDSRTHTQEKRSTGRLSFGDLHQRLLEQYAPPSIVVNENYDIVHLSDRAGRFLQVTGGEPSKNLLKMIRPELRLELRTALFQAVQNRVIIEAPNLTIQTDGDSETINLLVRPVLGDDDTARGFLLVLFEPSNDDTAQPSQRLLTSTEPIVSQLEEELERATAHLGSSIEQYEVQTEELRASNEELLAINEELRSSTEELETSREELQSVNEELLAVNQELKNKIEELSLSNADFQNLMNSTDVGTIFLDRSSRVKMFTPNVKQLFNLIEADLNRPLADITTKLNFEDLHRVVEKVTDTLQTVEREIEAENGRWYLMRVFPYRTTEDQISGTVVTFIDITRRRLSEDKLSVAAKELEQQARIFDTTLSNITDFAYTFDLEGRFLFANRPLLDLLGLEPAQIVGKNFLDLNYPADLAARLQKQIQQVIDTKQIVRDETPFVGADGADGFYEYIFSPYLAEDGATVERVVGTTRDVTERKQAEKILRDSETQMRLVVEAAEMGTWDWNLLSGEVRWNEQHYLLFGREPGDGWVTYEDFERGVHPDDRQTVRERLEKAIEEDKVFQTEFRAVHPDGTMRWMSGYGRVVEKDADGRASRMTGVMFDATERREAETALRESEERLRLLVESASDYAIFTTSLDNLIDSWNKGAEKVFGWTESEALGQSGAIIFTPEDRAAGAPELEIKTALRNGRAPDERYHLRKNGSRFYVSGVMTLLRDANGNLQGFVKIARDMTEQLEAEKAVRDKEILQKLIAALEDERKRIARDLHDELGQQLTALRLKLETTRKVCEEAEICDKIDEIQLIAKRIDADVDFLAWELRPAALDDLGLIASLENYVREWSHHTGVSAEFHAVKSKKLRLTSEVETNLYRIAQEALNNVHKHAEAKSVSVVLEKRDDLIVLIVEDDGRGFNPKLRKNRSKGLGLMGMHERAALLKGTFEIESAPKQGTTVYVRVPAAIVKKEKKNV